MRLPWSFLFAVIAGPLLLAGCHKKPADTKQATTPVATAQAEDEDNCHADAAWLTASKEPDGAPIADEKPDCEFYRAAERRFLWATRMQGSQPAFVGFPNIEKLFGRDASPLFPAGGAGLETATFRVAKAPNAIGTAGSTDLLGSGIRQAGDIQGIVADANGNPIFYSIHVSPRFAAFIARSKLTTAAALRNAPDNLRFEGGVEEFKAGWQIVDDKNPPAGFILVRHAKVPRLRKVGDDLVIDTDHPRDVTLALIAFHVAFTLDNHPEMIWATFEHAPNGTTDVAPSATANHPAAPTVAANPGIRYALYAPGSSAAGSNQSASAADFDEGTQRFIKSSPIYREFPGSKQDKPDQDGAVLSLGDHTRGLKGIDVRGNYRLVGAVWLKHPGSSFKLDQKFRNNAGQSSDEKTAMLSGEGALSSIAMESFTQHDFVNCFACHDTRTVSRDTEPFDNIVDSKLLNVSHVMSRFLAETPAEKK